MEKVAKKKSMEWTDQWPVHPICGGGCWPALGASVQPRRLPRIPSNQPGGGAATTSPNICSAFLKYYLISNQPVCWKLWETAENDKERFFCTIINYQLWFCWWWMCLLGWLRCQSPCVKCWTMLVDNNDESKIAWHFKLFNRQCTTGEQLI